MYPYYYGYYGYGSNLGFVLVLLASLLAIYAQFKVKGTYRKYKDIPTVCGKTGAQVAREILDANGLYHIDVKQVSGELSDHYDPTKNVINLSRPIYLGTSIAALSVAAHECGHAIQYKEEYSPIKMRNAIIPFANAGQYLGWISIVLGLALGYTSIAWVGLLLMCGILLFQIVTLPVEFNASSRGLMILQDRYLTSYEYPGAQKMLKAAALTYVAAMIQTLMSLLRTCLIISSRSRRD